MVTRLGIVTHGALAALLAVFCQGALGQISLSWELGASSPARQTFEAGRFSQAAQILTDASLAGEQGELDLARSHIASGNYENGRSILDKLLPRLRSTPNRHWLGEALVLAADLDFNHSLAQRLADASEAVEIFQAIEGRTGRNSVKAQALRAMIASDINANQGLALDADVQKNEAEGTTLTPRDRLWIKLANGVSLFKAGKREQANSVLADVVPAFSSLMGLEHPDMLYATYIHALVLQRLGKYETVYPLLVELQTRQAAVLGPDHPYRVRTLVLLVPEAVRVRDWSLATATAQTVVDLTRNRYGAQSVRYLATQGNLASVYLDAGNFPMAADIQSKALQGLAVVANGQTAHVDALYNMAMIDRARDHIGASLEGFQKVNEFDLKRLPVGHQDSWPVLSNIATLHTQLGNKPRGLSVYRDVERQMLGQLPPDHPNLISVQNNIAATLIEMKDWRAAAPLLESIVARLEKRFPSGNDQLLRAKANLAAAYLNTNRVDGAEELSRYVLLMRQRDSPVNRPNIFKSMHQLASVLEAKRDYPAALRQYKEVYELRKKYLGTHHVETITTARAIGGLYADTGDTQSACAIYAEVIASIEKLRDYGPTSEQFKQAYFRDFAQAYKYYARLLGRLGRWDEAFRVAEGSKARTLTESTRLRLSSLSKTITVQEAADLDQLERRVVTMNTRIAMHNAVNAPASKLLEYETERDASLQLLSGKRTALAATYGWTEPSVAASTFTPKDAALNLEAGDVFVSFAMLGDSLVGMALDRQGAVTGKLVTQPGLARSIKVLRLLLSQPNGMDFYRMGDDLTPPHRLWKLQTGGFALEPLEDGPIAGAAIAKSTGDVLEFVSNAVLSAVPANTWSAKRLVISPDEELALLPFDALTREGKPLIVKREIVFAQSWTMHTLLRQREIAYSTLNRAPMLVFGNATYGDTSVRGKTRGFEGGGGRTQSSDASTPRPFVDLKWFSLPGSAVEIEAIKTLYALKSRINFFSGDDASEDSLRQLDRNGQLANYRIVLFSGHGYLHPSQPMLSSIVLAQKASPVTGIEAAEKGESDGYVTAAEVMGMHLHSDLVVLSACQSGLGEIVSGEGVTGLPFGLFSAGNRSTLLTLWSIYDGSSGKFVESFVRKVKKGTRFSSALAQTKREFIEGKAGRSSVGAAHWAPFVMYGT